MRARAGTSAARRRAIQNFFRLARRLHLYFGLFLVPWVCLYGCTALFFNHPDWLHPRTMDRLGPEVFAASTLAEPPEKNALAAAVHAALPGTLSEPENIRWVGRYRLRGEDEAHRYSLYAEPDGRSGVMYTTPLELPGAHPMEALDSVEVPFALSRNDAWPTIEESLGVGTLTLDRAPDLMFDVRDGEDLWRVEYSPLSGELSAEQLADRPTAPTTRSFLTHLHTQHVYPGAVTTRWLWAVLVDVMGGAVILAGVGSMALLGWSLYASLGF